MVQYVETLLTRNNWRENTFNQKCSENRKNAEETKQQQQKRTEKRLRENWGPYNHKSNNGN